MPRMSARLSLVFASIGHAYVHLFIAFYFVIVLQLEKAWAMPYHEAIELWTLGALLVGLCAIPAGWLGDRWSAPGMMVVMFFGMGAASIYCGMADTPSQMLIGLSLLGVFAAIYHPVAVTWVVRNAKARGKALGINGIFGSLGVAGSGAITGLLIDLYSWQAAFIVPGVLSIITGIALLTLLLTGVIVDNKDDLHPEEPPSRNDMLRGFGILLLTMACMGLAFHAMQTALPKVFSLRLGEWAESGTFGIGMFVAAVYLISGVMQVVGGHLADRYALKPIYIGGLLLQIPMLALVAQISGMPLVIAATMAVFFNSGILPAENMLIARFTPAAHRSLAYGIKFVLAFATAPLAVILVSKLVEMTGEFVWLYWVIALIMLIACLVALCLPSPSVATTRSQLVPVPAK